MRLINKCSYALDLQAVPPASDEDPSPAPVQAFVSNFVKGADGEVVHNGSTVIPDADWEVLKQHAGVKHYMRLGFLVAAPDRGAKAVEPATIDVNVSVSDAAPPPKDRPAKDDLSGFSAAEAVEYASTIDTLEEVHSLLEVEDRKTVKAALERRLKDLSN